MLKFWAVTEWSKPCRITAHFLWQNGIMDKLNSLRLTLAAGLLAIGGLCAPAMAQTDESEMPPLFTVDPIFRDGLKGFQSLDGKAFSLKRRGNETLFRFDDTPEIWALESVPGPRGDEFLKNDVGRVFVRLTDLGGVILYDPQHPEGQPVDPVENPVAITDPVFEDNLASNLSIYTSVRIGKNVRFEFEDASEPTAVWLQDAARVVAEGMVRSDKIARQKIDTISLVTGNVPDVRFEKPGRLIVAVNPKDGYAGRPSTDRLVYLLKDLVGS